MVIPLGPRGAQIPDGSLSLADLGAPANSAAQVVRVNSEGTGYELHALAKADVGLANVLNAEQQTYHGFASLPDAPTFSGTTITVPGTTAYDVYIGGAKSTISTPKTVDLSLMGSWSALQADNLGIWYVYMKSDLTLEASMSSWSILDTTAIPVLTVYLQDGGESTYTGIIAKEMHSHARNLREHHNQHVSWGAQYVSGFATLTIGGGDPTVNSFSLQGGVFRDEDLFFTLSNPQTHCRIGYRSSATSKMVFDADGTTYVKQDGSSNPYYDNNGTLTPLTNNNFGIYWIYATNHYSTPVVSIMGQGDYATIGAAQTAPQPTLAGFSVAEWKLLYRVIIKRTSGSPLVWVQSNPMFNLSTGPAIQAQSVSTVSAGNVSFVPSGNIAATNLQAAVEELDSEKAAASHSLTSHTESGLTTGHFLKATGATTTGFAAHGLTASDVGALSSSGGSMAGFLTLHADPTSAMHAVTKQYADAIASGFGPKDACKWATTATLVATSYSSKVLTASSNGAISIDGGSPALNDRVLVKNGVNVNGTGSSNVYNGIYYVSQVGDGSNPWKLTRATDFDGTPEGEVTNGDYTFVVAGTANAKSGWAVTTTGTIVLDTDAIEFSTVSQLPGTANASSITNTPSGNITATDVQAALNELDNEKAAVAQTMYIGTTQVAINRSSASLSLSGISIDGTAETANKIRTSAPQSPANGDIWIA